MVKQFGDVGKRKSSVNKKSLFITLQVCIFKKLLDFLKWRELYMHAPKQLAFYQSCKNIYMAYNVNGLKVEKLFCHSLCILKHIKVPWLQSMLINYMTWQLSIKSLVFQ